MSPEHDFTILANDDGNEAITCSCGWTISQFLPPNLAHIEWRVHFEAAVAPEPAVAAQVRRTADGGYTYRIIDLRTDEPIVEAGEEFMSEAGAEEFALIELKEAARGAHTWRTVATLPIEATP